MHYSGTDASWLLWCGDAFSVQTCILQTGGSTGRSDLVSEGRFAQARDTFVVRRCTRRFDCLLKQTTRNIARPRWRSDVVDERRTE